MPARKLSKDLRKRNSSIDPEKDITKKTQSSDGLCHGMGIADGIRYMGQFQRFLMAAMITILGSMLIAGDIGCYLAWHCVDVIDWHGKSGILLVVISLPVWYMAWKKR